MNVYRYEIEPRPAALGGGVRPSGPEEAEIKEAYAEAQREEIPGSTRGPALESNIKRS